MHSSCFILIIAQNWLTGSLIGAQLKEEDFKVLGSPTIKEAIARLEQTGVKPVLLIIEARGLDIDQVYVDRLGSLCPGIPLVLIHGAWDRPAEMKWAGNVCEVKKPLTVEQIVDKVRSLLR